MPEHGDYDQEKLTWYCSRWMNQKEWLDIHGYSPISAETEADGNDSTDTDNN